MSRLFTSGRFTAEPRSQAGLGIKFLAAKFIFTVFCFSLVFTADLSHALTPLVLTPDPDSHLLDGHFEIFENADPALGIEDLISPEFDGRFKPFRGQRLKYRYDYPVNWIRFAVTLPPTGPAGIKERRENNWFFISDYAYFHTIDLFGPFYGPGWNLGGNEYQKLSLGMDVDYSAWDIKFNEPIFPLGTLTDKPAWFYVRTVTKDLIPIQNRIISNSALVGHIYWSSLFYGLCYGVLLCMLAYNLFIYFSLHLPVYLIYVLYISSLFISLVFLNGHSSTLVELKAATHMKIMWFFIGSFTFWALFFMRSFLETRSNAPLIDKTLKLAQLYAVAISVLGLSGYHQIAWGISFFSLFFSPSLGLVAGLVCLYRGFRAARYYLFAWGALSTSTIILALHFSGFLPNWPFLSDSLLVGSTVETTLLSLAMADRIRILKHEKETLERNEENFRRLSQTDPLTGLFNKRVFNTALTASLSQALNNATPMSLLMVDVDDFKKINDSCGHLEGDRVLIELGNVLKNNVRSKDICCRYGGEEFAIILPCADIDQALQVAERLRGCFEDLRFEMSDQIDRATVSIGLAKYTAEDTEQSLISRADQALYQAKRSGKNRVVIGR